jgi:thiamine biosynthesis lipoprotein ApbE
MERIAFEGATGNLDSAAYRCGNETSRRSATAVAASSFLAGRFAAAAFLLGPEAGLELLEDSAGVEGALIVEDGTILATTGMERLSDLPGSLYAAYPAL